MMYLLKPRAFGMNQQVVGFYEPLTAWGCWALGPRQKDLEGRVGGRPGRPVPHQVPRELTRTV